MMGEARGTATLIVRRGGPGEATREDSFAIPFESGQTVLDGLRWIQVHADPGLAFRYACINANACKQCVMRIDGRNAYACTTRLRAGEMTVAPLPNKPVLRDLLADTAPRAERLDEN